MKLRPGGLCAVLICLWSGSAHAEDPGVPAAPSNEGAASREKSSAANALESDRYLLGGVLAGWSLASIATGASMVATAGETDDFECSMGIQHLAWGGVDLALAGLSLATARVAPEDDAPTSLAEARDLYATVLWVNVALDVAYVVAGSLLWAMPEDRKVQGTGAGIVVQGGFLFAYDLAGALWLGR